ncbi:MAG: hypothetical protein WC028_30260 [Candidatus Obscuribacterales bacterium]
MPVPTTEAEIDKLNLASTGPKTLLTSNRPQVILGQLLLTNPDEHSGDSEPDLVALIGAQQTVLGHIGQTHYFDSGSITSRFGDSLRQCMPGSGFVLLPPMGSGLSELQVEFDKLATCWRRDTSILSSSSSSSMHPAYQRIIGMGPKVLPCILRDLEATYDQWFWALEAITGQNPVPSEFRGSVPKMAECWLRFGRENHLIK